MNRHFLVVPLGEVLQLRIDAVPVDPSISYMMAGVYSFGRGLFKRGPLSGTETTYKFLHRLHKDHFVISQPKAWEGALARVPMEFDGLFLSSVFPTFRALPDCLDVRYLEWYCKQATVWEELRSKARGMGARRESVFPNQFLSLTIPLPTLSEQQRIVAKIDELASKIEEARRLRHQARGEVELLVQSKINEIIRQKLDSKSWKLALLPDFVAPNRHAIKRGPFGSHLRKEYFVPSGYKVYEQKHAIYGDFGAGSYYITEEKFLELKSFEVKVDDLIISCSGTIGKAAIVPYGAEPGIINQALLKITLDTSKIDKRFFKLVFESDFIKKEVTAISPGSAMKNIGSVKILKQIKFPLPPLDEQQQIVADLDGFASKVNTLKPLQAKTAAELNALSSSILDKAFNGDL